MADVVAEQEFEAVYVLSGGVVCSQCLPESGQLMETRHH